MKHTLRLRLTTCTTHLLATLYITNRLFFTYGECSRLQSYLIIINIDTRWAVSAIIVYQLFMDRNWTCRMIIITYNHTRRRKMFCIIALTCTITIWTTTMMMMRTISTILHITMYIFIYIVIIITITITIIDITYKSTLLLAVIATRKRKVWWV